MQGEPSAKLLSLLARLKLATREQVQGVAAHARRLAGDLPDFEPVWVDALAQAGILTPLQAAWINQARGEDLLCGPYLIERKLSGSYFAECFAAVHVETRRAARLYLVQRPQGTPELLVRAADEWAAASRTLPERQLGVNEWGLQGDTLWATCAAIESVSAADWMVENGRLPPDAVLEIARQLVALLAELDHHRLMHGDVAASSLQLSSSGQIVLPMPGLRGLVRPAEGYSFCDLPPEGFNSLSPERIDEGTPPSIASDLYACGSLWWHLLTGRSPFASGSGLLKLKAIHASKVTDVRVYCPDLPESLAVAIDLTLRRDLRQRPKSFHELSDLLGPPTRTGAALLARCVQHPTQVWYAPRRTTIDRPAGNARTTLRAVAAASVLIAIAAVGVAVQRHGSARAMHTASATPQPPAATKPPSLADSPDASPQARVNAAQTPLRQESPLPRDPRPTNTVRAASAAEPIAERGAGPLILPAGKTVLRGALSVRPGQTVRGRGDQRPLISVPREGLVIRSDDVRFERVDFVWEHEVEGASRRRPTAMIVLEASAIEFSNCTFSALNNDPPAALALAGGAEPSAASGSEVVFVDCVLRNTSAAVDCLTLSQLSVQLTNSLCLSSGPVLRLHAPPRASEAATITLERVTARGDSPVVSCLATRDSATGPISIQAGNCVFDTHSSSALLVFEGVKPSQLLGAVSWNGHGSLVTPSASIAQWHARQGTLESVEEDQIEIAGLTRAEVTFAGPIDGPPGASRIVEWQGPLRSEEPPGARVHVLSAAVSRSAKAARPVAPR